MRLEGEVYFGFGTEPDARVTEAVVTPSRISIDWKEDLMGHLDANTTDGRTFRGHYGYPQRDETLEYELTLYRSNDDFLLFGTWCEHDTGTEGIWVFRLWPTDKSSSKKAATMRKPVRAEQKSRPRYAPTQSSKSKAATTAKPRLTPASAQIARSRKQKSSGKNRKSSFSENQPRKPAPISPSPKAPKVIVPYVPPGSQLDHLLQVPESEFLGPRNQAIKAELAAARMAPLFKLSRDALSPALRQEALRVFNKR